MKEGFEAGAERGSDSVSGIEGEELPERSTDCLSFLDRRRRCMLSFALCRGLGVVGSTNLGRVGGTGAIGMVPAGLSMTWARLGVDIDWNSSGIAKENAASSSLINGADSTPLMGISSSLSSLRGNGEGDAG